MTGETAPFERTVERQRLLSTARQGTTALIFGSKGIHIAGDRDTGKTWLVNKACKDIDELDRIVAVKGNLDAKWETLDPIERILALRNSLSASFNKFDPEAFDLLLPIFLAKFRPGYGYVVKQAGPPDLQPVEDTLRDTTKKALEGVVSDLTNAGTAAGGSAAIVGAAKIAGAGGAVASASTIVLPAITVGAITFVTAAGAVVLKKLIRGHRRKARRRGLFRRYDRLAYLMSSDQPDYDEFFDYLAFLIGDAIASMYGDRYGYLAVLYLDPSDDLADYPEGPAGPIGQLLSEVFRHAGRQLVIATSRQPLDAWLRKTREYKTAPDVNYDKIELHHFDVAETELSARRLGYDGKWPADDILLVDERYIRPKEFHDWWQRFNKPPVAESEPV